MKFIDSKNFKEDLADIAVRFRVKGIAASTTDDYANIPGKTYLAKNIKMGIWVHLDHQYQDALALIANPNHHPTTALTEAEMEHIKEASKNALGNFAETLFTKLITILLATGLIALIFYVAISIT